MSNLKAIRQKLEELQKSLIAQFDKINTERTAVANEIGFCKEDMAHLLERMVTTSDESVINDYDEKSKK